MYVFALLAALMAGAISLRDYLQEKALHALPYGFKNFNLSDSLPKCGRWKEHMPSARDQATYHLYIEARKVWRSKIAWQLTHEETARILTDVSKAADLGDWGARALMTHFYLYGLGVLESNHVLDADPEKAVEITRLAAKLGQPWALFDLGVAYENGYGGVPYDKDLAWAYYLRAAERGSPDAQMTLAKAYGDAGRLQDEETMRQCAYQQGHGPAAFALGVDRRVDKKFKEAIVYFHDGTKFGDMDCADALEQLFDMGYWVTTDNEDKPVLKEQGFAADPERSRRYREISSVLAINPDLKLSRLDLVLPLPPAELPEWFGIDGVIEPERKGLPAY